MKTTGGRCICAKYDRTIMSRIGKPTTTGKIERFFATYSTEAWRYNALDGVIQYYNYIRPHQSLDYQTPAERLWDERRTRS